MYCRSCIVIAQAFLNNFENVVNQRIDTQEDIKHYQETLSYALSKADSMGQGGYLFAS